MNCWGMAIWLVSSYVWGSEVLWWGASVVSALHWGKRIKNHTDKSLPVTSLFGLLKWMFPGMNDQVAIQKGQYKESNQSYTVLKINSTSPKGWEHIIGEQNEGSWEKCAVISVKCVHLASVTKLEWSSYSLQIFIRFYPLQQDLFFSPSLG